MILSNTLHSPKFQRKCGFGRELEAGCGVEVRAIWEDGCDDEYGNALSKLGK